jgi:sulfur-carrier protein
MLSPDSMPRTAPITVQVPTVLRARCDGASELALSAPSVRAALVDLERRYPALHQCICDETGAVRRHVNLFVNKDNVRDGEGVDTPLSPGDVLTILPAVSGG